MRHTRIDPSIEGRPVDPWSAARAGVPMRVADCMSQPIVTVRRDQTLDAAWTLMRERKIRHLPVVDAQDRLVGIVTDRDLRQALLDPSLRVRARRLSASLAALPVEHVMTRAAVTVRPGTEMREAALLMHERKIGAVPVVDDAGVVVGILSETDVLRAFVDVVGARAIPRALRLMIAPAPPRPRDPRHAAGLAG